MNDEMHAQIELFCEMFLEQNELEDGDVVYDLEFLATSDGHPYKAIIDICFFRGEYIFDVIRIIYMSDNSYANEFLDNVCFN